MATHGVKDSRTKVALLTYPWVAFVPPGAGSPACVGDAGPPAYGCTPRDSRALRVAAQRPAAAPDSRASVQPGGRHKGRSETCPASGGPAPPTAASPPEGTHGSSRRATKVINPTPPASTFLADTTRPAVERYQEMNDANGRLSMFPRRWVSARFAASPTGSSWEVGAAWWRMGHVALLVLCGYA